MKKENTDEKPIEKQEEAAETGSDDMADHVNEEDQSTEASAPQDELEKLKDELAESKDKYLRLYSEFENFRRRTAKEKLDMIQTANEALMTAMIPVIDDFERAEKSFEEKDVDVKAVKEGVALISGKFKKILEQQGLIPMEGKQGMAFDADYHEAITQIPAPDKKLKGKVVDVIEKGYLLKEKVIRYAKVVVGN